MVVWGSVATDNATVTPKVEYRLSHLAPFDPNDPSTVDGSGPLSRFGSSFRAAVDLGFEVADWANLVLNGSGLFGEFEPFGTAVDFGGFRVAVHFEVTP